MLSLRDYQENSILRVEDAFHRGCQGVFLVLPTGAGKTVVFTEMIKNRNRLLKKCVVVAHRTELIKQAGRTIEKNGMWHGVIKAKPSTAPLAPIQVVSIDSMRNRGLPWEPDLIVLDEAHLSKASRYTHFLAKYPDAKRLLVSATPIRADGTGFADIANELVVGSTIQELIDHPEGPFLVTPRIYTGSHIEGQLESMRMVAGEYNQSDLEELMSSVSLVGDVLEKYKETAIGRKGVVFCVGIQHSKMVCQQFNEAGIPAEHLDGGTPENERDAILKRLSTGETQIVTNCAVLTEGWDEPTISYVGLAKPTKALALYIQMAGRGLRIHPGKIDCIINDHGSNVEEHGHILEPRDWSLDGKVFKDKKKRKYKECRKCGEWIPVKASTCPVCNFVMIVPVEVNIAPASFVETKEEFTNPILREYRVLLKFAKKNKRPAGWAYFKLVGKFGQERVSQIVSQGISKKYQADFYYA